MIGTWWLWSLMNFDNHITSTLLSRQNKRNLCYGPIQVTGVLRNSYCNFLKKNNFIK